MGEWRLFEEGTVPEYTTPAWYADRERAPHLEQDLHRGRLEEAAAQVVQAAKAYVLTTAVDLGAGDGGLLSLLPNDVIRSCWGYDLQQTNVDAARKNRHVAVNLGDVVTGIGWYQPYRPAGANRRSPIEWGEIAVCTEMLEHLIDPHAFVQTVYDNARVIVASSPYTERPGSAYAYHTWAWDPEGYKALMEQAGFRVIQHELTGMFQVLTGVRA